MRMQHNRGEILLTGYGRNGTVTYRRMHMKSLPMIAIVPQWEGPAPGCQVLYENGHWCHRYCGVEKYMNTLAALLGNDNRACRKLFCGKRGTGIRLNDGSVFVQIKLSQRAPTLGYVRLDALDRWKGGENGNCVLHLSNGQALPTFWKLETVDRHIQMVKDRLESMDTEVMEEI